MSVRANINTRNDLAAKATVTAGIVDQRNKE